ncbi:glycoside hydrolase family 3 C-terminal domain-containing protein [Streptomyces sp. NBC_00669]|uniref:glycoside hydrolase family 3 C-terminal domain-containing protein n=1 Tax=Streptomyces sp. NBC_00669 TaxID=2976011 RepID=UPI002E3219D6|nr:glycoside hydrolase family 3 C-terminal domain-containing protein [Streptomyces sp. NBC_00669]
MPRSHDHRPGRTPIRRRLPLGVAGVAAALLLTVTAGQVPAAAGGAAGAGAGCPWVGSSASPAQRAAQVLARMTVDEKLSMTHGSGLPGYAGVVAPVPRLCVPALNLNDGGAGVVMGGTTALPAPVAAAASWDPAAERSYGQVVGAEAKTKGISVDLGPDTNLERDPRGGRVFEMAGEDPYLSGAMTTQYVKGVQSKGVMADIKHLVANDTEQNRNNGNAIVDERTLHEIYYPAFEQAVQEGGAASIMAATSLVNGVHANENATLLKDTAKQDWGFDGFVVTDWDGARSTVQAANAELDLNMPAPGNFGQPLSDAVRSGQVSMAVLNDKVARLLTEEFAYGLFDSTAGSPGATATTPAHVATARDIAAEGTVLMKNKGGLLPLKTSATPSIAVIGAAAKDSAITGGGGSSHVPVDPSSVVTVADGIAARAGSSVRVDTVGSWTGAASSSASGSDQPANMFDGDLGTRWSSGTPMAGGQWVSADMGGSHPIDRITMDAGNGTDYARGYQVYLSADGKDWGAPVAEGTGTGRRVTATFAARQARYVRIVQTGSASSWWSIAELTAYTSDGSGGQTAVGRSGVRVPGVTDKLPTVPSARFSTAGGQQGLTASYYNNLDLSGAPALTRVEPDIDDHYTAAPGPGVNPAGFSVRWTGFLTAPVTGTYTFSMADTGGVRMTVGGQPVFQDWAQYGPGVSAIHLKGGVRTPITVENYQPVNGPSGPVAGTPTTPPGNGSVTLGWQVPDTSAIAAAAAAAKQDSVAVVVVSDDESEDGDRQNLTLPGAQDDLVAAVAAANPHTVVVLNTGAPVLMPWLGSVDGVLESWYGGQQNGAALASVLFGDVDPSGKLPQTWPASMSQLPTADPSRYPGTVDVATNTTDYHYSEGLDVGYRWYDAHHLTPLFPFGYGLTYSSFSFGGLSVSPGAADAAGPVRVSATVRNTGSRTASEVAQLYVSDPAGAGEPPKQLKGFQRVTLRPGRSQRVTFTIDPSDLRTWDDATHAWKTNDGTYRMYVGDSSRDLPLSGSYTLRRSTGARAVTAQAPATLDPAHGGVVTTTLTAGGTQTLGHVRLGLDVPAGWTAKARTTAEFRSVKPGTRLTTSWLVTPAAGAQDRLWRLTAEASADGGYRARGGLQVTVGPLVAATLSSTTKLARTGGSYPATLTLRNTADQRVSVSVGTDAPAEVSVDPATTSVVLAPRASVTKQLTVSVGNDAASASIDLTGTVTAAGQDHPLQGGSLDLPLLFDSLAAAYDNTAVSDDAAPQSANFDGSGYSYSAQSLAGAGLTPGQPVPHGTAALTWPSAAAGHPDNVVAAGQNIAVSGSGTQLWFLGAANNGSGSGTGTLTYTDGSTAPFTLGLTNWTPSTPLPGDDLVATAPTWNRPAGSGYPAATAVSVYATKVPLAAGKTLAYVTLPATVTGDQAGTRLHVFDIAVE